MIKEFENNSKCPYTEDLYVGHACEYCKFYGGVSKDGNSTRCIFDISLLIDNELANTKEKGDTDVLFKRTKSK